MDARLPAPGGVVVLPAPESGERLERHRIRTLSERPDVRCIVLTDGVTADESTAAALPLLATPVVFTFERNLAGSGAALALGSDIRVCGPDARLVLPGAPASPWFQARLDRLMGSDAASLRGRDLPAAELLAAGLVSLVANDALTEARRLASAIATRGPIAEELGKEALWRGLEMPLAQALRFETDLTLLLQTTKDRAEGVRAFLEKRQPVFKGE